MHLLFRDIRCVDGREPVARDHVDVRVQGERIAAVEDHDPERAIPEGDLRQTMSAVRPARVIPLVVTHLAALPGSESFRRTLAIVPDYRCRTPDGPDQLTVRGIEGPGPEPGR